MSRSSFWVNNICGADIGEDDASSILGSLGVDPSIAATAQSMLPTQGQKNAFQQGLHAAGKVVGTVGHLFRLGHHHKVHNIPAIAQARAAIPVPHQPGFNAAVSLVAGSGKRPLPPMPPIHQAAYLMTHGAAGSPSPQAVVDSAVVGGGSAGAQKALGEIASKPSWWHRLLRAIHIEHATVGVGCCGQCGAPAVAGDPCCGQCGFNGECCGQCGTPAVAGEECCSGCGNASVTYAPACMAPDVGCESCGGTCFNGECLTCGAFHGRPAPPTGRGGYRTGGYRSGYRNRPAPPMQQQQQQPQAPQSPDPSADASAQDASAAPADDGSGDGTADAGFGMHRNRSWFA